MIQNVLLKTLGFGLGQDPTLTPLLYDPTAPLGSRWTEYPASTIPRMYHSVALMLLDGTVLISGSNPVEQPVLESTIVNPYVTEFRNERWIPPYLSGGNVHKRPTSIQLFNLTMSCDGSVYFVNFTCPIITKNVKIAILHGGFVTHSLHMGQRMLFLETSQFQHGIPFQRIRFCMPPTTNSCPPGPWVLYILCDGIPSVGQPFMIPTQ